MRPFFITIPHSGEKVPPEATWLKNLPEVVLMCDVDRYVDEIYGSGIVFLGIPSVVAQIHRYVIDLNRLEDDVDQDSVDGSAHPSGMFTTGLHWVETTTKSALMKAPISKKLHEDLIATYFHPFHSQVEKVYAEFKSKGFKKVYHLDAHSMPSFGTSAHRDPGQKRAEIVVSDQDGVSCEKKFRDLVVEAYKKAGFQVECNWPYKGGRITQVYGRPQKGQHVLQVEMNRALYMNEVTKQKYPQKLLEVQKQVTLALGIITSELKTE